MQPDTKTTEALRTLERLALVRASAVRELTEDERTALDAAGGPCAHCGGYHARACPRVKRLAFHPNGGAAEVEFWPHNVIDWTGVLFDDGGDQPDIKAGELDSSEVEDLERVVRWVLFTAKQQAGIGDVKDAATRLLETVRAIQEASDPQE